MSKFFETLRGFFRKPQIKSHEPHLERTYGPGVPGADVFNNLNSSLQTEVSESQHRKNMERIEIARLTQDRESINHNLASQHRVLVVTAIATLIALFSSVSAIFIAITQDEPVPPPAPIVNVQPSQPDVNVYIPEVKTNENPSGVK